MENLIDIALESQRFDPARSILGTRDQTCSCWVDVAASALDHARLAQRPDLRNRRAQFLRRLAGREKRSTSALSSIQFLSGCAVPNPLLRGLLMVLGLVERFEHGFRSVVGFDVVSCMVFARLLYRSLAWNRRHINDWVRD